VVRWPHLCNSPCVPPEVSVDFFHLA
jgi:hypothetical protein